MLNFEIEMARFYVTDFLLEKLLQLLPIASVKNLYTRHRVRHILKTMLWLAETATVRQQHQSLAELAPGLDADFFMQCCHDLRAGKLTPDALVKLFDAVRDSEAKPVAPENAVETSNLQTYTDHIPDSLTVH